jgi:KipI family sensor histidine kinase inhibitor
VDIVPAYTTVLVGFDPALTDAANVEDAVRSVLPGLGIHSATTRLREIPVHYGGKDGPDLADVAAHVGLPPGEVVTRHAAATYRVACVGFCPGFAFLLGLPTELDTPRRRTPRTRVPTGSVAIGGAQTGVYPMETPGGWNLIGRTNLTLFDPTRPDPFFLRPGDEVRFVPEDGVEESSSRGVEEGERSRREDDAFDVQSGVARDTGSDTGSAVAPFGGSRDGERTVAVLDGGAQATVQDLGRPGLMHLGVSPGGALDRRALVLGNRLLGNDPGSAGVEIALSGPRLRFGAAALAVLTGADLGAALDGTPLPCWQPFAIDPGQALAFTRPARPGSGLRAYLCLDGGVATSPVMDSRSTDLFGRIGGIGGRALRTGDVLPLGPPAEDPASVMRRRLTGPPPAPEDDAGPIRVVLGPQVDRFTAEGVATLLESNWAVSLRSDRMGLRLSGPAISLSAGADTVSEGIAAGSIQVPGDGQPIALLPARQTVGGYPKIAVVIGADLDRLGQLGPERHAAFRRGLPGRGAAVDAGGALSNRGTGCGRGSARTAGGWRGIGGIRGDESNGGPRGLGFRCSGARRPRAGGDGGDALPTRARWPAAIHARMGAHHGSPGRRGGRSTEEAGRGRTTGFVDSLLGDSGPHRGHRPAPRHLLPPPRSRPTAYAEEGQQVEDGAVLGLIEVMKTYHEVRAPRAGVVEAFLVEDGATVQFGEPLARLA